MREFQIESQSCNKKGVVQPDNLILNCHPIYNKQILLRSNNNILIAVLLQKVLVSNYAYGYYNDQSGLLS